MNRNANEDRTGPDPDGSEGPGAGRTASAAGTRESLRIGGLFLLALVGLYVLRLAVDQAVILPFTRFIADVTAWILGLGGASVGRTGTVVHYGEISLNILEECNGVPALIVFLAAILAYPAPGYVSLASLRAKGIGILLGVPAIFVVNEVRVLSLFFVYEHMSPRVFDLMHVYVWQIAIILFAVLLWLYWAERFVRKTGTEDPSP